MKRTVVAAILGGLLAVAGVFFASKPSAMKMVATVHADGGARCSLGAAAGNYGFTLTGTLVLPTGNVPVAGVGLVTIGADGSFSGTESRSIGGSIAQETIGAANKTVNSDCTSTLTAPVFESGQVVRTSTFSLVFDDNASAFRAIQTSLVLPDGTSLPNVITGSGTKLRTLSGE